MNNFKEIIGKTIVGASQLAHKDYDDSGWLLLEFSDGTECTIVAGYGGYTGRSEDEYPTDIWITKTNTKLVRLENGN